MDSSNKKLRMYLDNTRNGSHIDITTWTLFSGENQKL